MKLYRGLKSEEFFSFTPEMEKQLKTTWEKIIGQRSKGSFSYPSDLNSDILVASNLVRLQRQYFTDQKDIAHKYAKSNEGVLIEIDLSTKQIMDYFKIEFQNFSKRKSNFELVYVVDAADLSKNAKKWKLKVDFFAKK